MIKNQQNDFKKGYDMEPPAFVLFDEEQQTSVENNHGGVGSIDFRRLLKAADFTSRIDFIDHTRIPPGSTIGVHQHIGNEEVYFIQQGNPLVSVNDTQKRLSPGSITVVRSGQTHSLINDTEDDVYIFVIQVSI